MYLRLFDLNTENNAEKNKNNVAFGENCQFLAKIAKK
jgi:hypothetical protein